MDLRRKWLKVIVDVFIKIKVYFLITNFLLLKFPASQLMIFRPFPSGLIVQSNNWNSGRKLLARGRGRERFKKSTALGLWGTR